MGQQQATEEKPVEDKEPQPLKDEDIYNVTEINVQDDNGLLTSPDGAFVMPPELMAKIFGNLEVQTILEIQYICKNWYLLCWADSSILDFRKTKLRLKPRALTSVIHRCARISHSLNLKNCWNCTDALIHTIPTGSLRILNLSACLDITNTALLHIAKMKSLRVLVLTHCMRISDPGIWAIRNMQLTDLHLNVCNNLSTCKGLSQMTTLTTLNLSRVRCTTTQNALVEAMSLTKLQRVDMSVMTSDNTFKEVALDLTVFKDLNELCVDAISVTRIPGILDQLRTMPSFHTLYLPSGLRNTVIEGHFRVVHAPHDWL
mmetsp:Transcript_29205/g.32432  ORF Transcript_29205/g.32432 Transcript_29205/m.32432 type:complete len:316 (-) Transcript_29205:44-991(-)